MRKALLYIAALLAIAIDGTVLVGGIVLSVYRSPWYAGLSVSYKTPFSPAAAAEQFLGSLVKPSDLAGQANALLAIVGLIAADGHPTGPARCPQRDGRDGEPCGSTDLAADGFCTQNQPEAAVNA